MRTIFPSRVIGAIMTAALRCTIVHERGSLRAGVCTRLVTTSRCALAKWRSLEIVFQPLSFTPQSVAVAVLSGKPRVSPTLDLPRNIRGIEPSFSHFFNHEWTPMNTHSENDFLPSPNGCRARYGCRDVFCV